MPHRHPVLYEVERWRAWRPWLLFPATISALTIVFTSFAHRLATSTLVAYAVVAVAGAAGSVALWARQRAVYVEVAGSALGLHALAEHMTIPLARFRRPRVAPLGRVMADRWLALPRPRERWAERDAVVMPLDGDGSGELARVRRVLGARCVVDGAVVVPVPDARRLAAEISGAMPALARPPGGGAAARRPGRRGRRR